MSKMITIISEGQSISFTTRILPLVDKLTSYKFDYTIIYPANWKGVVKNMYMLNKFLSIFFKYHFRDALKKIIKQASDIVFIDRISSFHIYILHKLLRVKNIKIVLDVSDALFLPTSKFLKIFRMRSPDYFYLEKIAQKSSLITVNGHFLRDYFLSKNANVKIIHDPIDTTLFNPDIKKKNDKLIIGWEGVPRHHYENLKLLLNPFRRLAKSYDFQFKMVSYLGDMNVKKIFKKLENLIEIDYGLAKWVPFKKFPQLMADFDILVSPLQKTLWNEGKSALKVGLGMALGIPVVASPVGEQKNIIKNGYNGFLARTHKEWYSALKLILEDSYLRKSIGRNAWNTVDNYLSLDIQAKNLRDSLLELL